MLSLFGSPGLWALSPNYHTHHGSLVLSKGFQMSGIKCWSSFFIGEMSCQALVQFVSFSYTVYIRDKFDYFRKSLKCISFGLNIILSIFSLLRYQKLIFIFNSDHNLYNKHIQLLPPLSLLYLCAGVHRGVSQWRDCFKVEQPYHHE